MLPVEPEHNPGEMDSDATAFAAVVLPMIFGGVTGLTVTLNPVVVNGSVHPPELEGKVTETYHVKCDTALRCFPKRTCAVLLL